MIAGEDRDTNERMAAVLRDRQQTHEEYLQEREEEALVRRSG